MKALAPEELQESLEAIRGSFVAQSLEPGPGGRNPVPAPFPRNSDSNRPPGEQPLDRSLQVSGVRDHLAAQRLAGNSGSAEDQAEHTAIKRVLPCRQEGFRPLGIHSGDEQVHVGAGVPRAEESMVLEAANVETQRGQWGKQEPRGGSEMDARVGGGGEDDLEATGIEELGGPGSVLRDIQADGLQTEGSLQAARKARGLRHVDGIGAAPR